jgi:hypothetical protein
VIVGAIIAVGSLLIGFTLGLGTGAVLGALGNDKGLRVL